MTRPDDVYNQAFDVAYSYAVHFTRGVFDAGNDILAKTIVGTGERRTHRVLVYVDSGLAEASGEILRDIENYFADHAAVMELVSPPIVAPGGEAAKNGWDDVRSIMGTIGNLRMCRQSYVCVVGGGGVLDMVGFATSLVHRGLRLIRIPSTVLAQNDAGVGVKNAMNERHTKNFVGTFAPPFAVINDFELLKSLNGRDWRAGISEAFKVAIIKDRDLLTDLCAAAPDLRTRDQAAMEDLVRRCAVLHLEHIRTSGDPFEFGSARPLDFGHWSAHRLETTSHHALNHGEAVAVGVALDCCYAARQQFISQSDLELVLNGLLKSGLPIWSDLLERRNETGQLAIFDGLEQFREHLGGELTLAMPCPIGCITQVTDIDRDDMLGALHDLKCFSHARAAK
jgi:3-dehydroquinate synthase